MDIGKTELNWFKTGPNDGIFKDTIMNSTRARNFLTYGYPYPYPSQFIVTLVPFTSPYLFSVFQYFMT
jgi:hypothetical protein